MSEFEKAVIEALRLIFEALSEISNMIYLLTVKIDRE